MNRTAIVEGCNAVASGLQCVGERTDGGLGSSFGTLEEYLEDCEWNNEGKKTRKHTKMPKTFSMYCFSRA